MEGLRGTGPRPRPRIVAAMSTAASAPGPSALATPGYVAYLAAATTARVADAMWPAVVLLVLARTDDASLAGLTMAGATLPTLVSAPVLGAWLDRTPHRRTALALNQVALIAALAGLLAAAGRVPGAVLPLLAVVAGITQPLVTGGYTGMLPDLVAPAALPRANALEAASMNATFVVGPALAGVLCAVRPEAGVVGQIVVALVPIAILPRLPVAGRPAAPGTTRPSLARDVLDGLRILVRVRALRSATAATVLASGALGLFVVAVPVQAEHLTGDPNDAGWLWAALALGAVLGGALSTRLGRGRPPTQVVVAGVALQGVAFIVWAGASGTATSLLVALLAGVPDGVALAALFAVRAASSPPELRSRVFTGAAGLKIAALSGGAGVSGSVVGALGPGCTFGAAGVVCLVAAATGALLFGRSRTA